MISYLLFFLGFALLIFGSHSLIRSLLALSKIFHVKPLFLSIVVLGFVTSSAEWFVTFIAAYKGVSELALSNVIGSNTINILLVLGLVGLICPFQKVDFQVLKFDLPCLLSFLVFLGLLSYDGLLSPIDCLLCLFVFVTYLYFLFQKRKEDDISENPAQISLGFFASLIWLIVGFICLFSGSHLMIDNSMKIGFSLGLSERFIGFFVLALGTSLPELAVSTVAAFKKEVEMILGNIVGSNIFNTLFIIGSAGLLQSLPVSPDLSKDYLFMFFTSLFLWFILLIFKGLPKIFSFLFLFAYTVYVFLFFGI